MNPLTHPLGRAALRALWRTGRHALITVVAAQLEPPRPPRLVSAQAAVDRPVGGMPPWRVGRKVGRTVYDADDVLIGVMDSPLLAGWVVEAVNTWHNLAVDATATREGRDDGI